MSADQVRMLLREAAQSIHPNPGVSTPASGRTQSSTELPWLVAMTTLGIIGILHVQRFFSAMTDARFGGDHSIREVLVVVLAFAGLYLFWRDVKQQRLFEGMLKLLGLLGVANILLPCLWNTVPLRVCNADREDEESLDDLAQR